MIQKLFFLLFIASASTANAQFTDEQITLLTKLNCALNGAWVMDGPEVPRPVAGRSNDPNEVQNLDFVLYHYNSWEGNEQGDVSISVFQKSQEADAKEDSQASDEIKVVYISTKSFFIVVEYSAEWNDFYDKEMKEIIPAIKNWFKENSDKL